jgi:4-diphosphocytidyl-2-C-methyl-D-erythritol kinase
MGNDKKEITLKAHAKINLCLYITGIRGDGYHLIDSIFMPVGIYDIIKISKSTGGIDLLCDGDIPNGPQNTAYKAAALLMECAGFAGVAIDIKKNIPHMAGLGGGSSDAAAVLIGINELYDLGISRDELLEIAIKIGADVPFFLGEGAAKVTGIGERIIPLNIKAKLNLVIVKPKQSLSTPEVFHVYDKLGKQDIKNSNELISALKACDIASIAANAGNDLQEAAQSLCPQIRDEISALNKYGAKAALMTGSGSCVFGIYDTREAAKEAARVYDGEGTAYAVCTVQSPVEII